MGVKVIGTIQEYPEVFVVITGEIIEVFINLEFAGPPGVEVPKKSEVSVELGLAAAAKLHNVHAAGLVGKIPFHVMVFSKRETFGARNGAAAAVIIAVYRFLEIFS
jgi:hypothetical protein